MAKIERQTVIVKGLSADQIDYPQLVSLGRPVIFKGVADEWELVRAGRVSPAHAMNYLRSYDCGKKLLSYCGGSEIKGRYFYNQEMTGLNYETDWILLDTFLEKIEATLDCDNPDSLFIGSATVEACFPRMKTHNGLPLNKTILRASSLLYSIWIGNRTLTSAHFDLSNNLACCLVGQRRFTLFPPDQVSNLYLGPIEPTPGGQVVSMVDSRCPDFAKYPKYRDAMAAAEVAYMEAGDVLFYPSMWWHEVESLGDFNVMANYWWNTAPNCIDSPQTTLLHAMLSLRNRSASEKLAWKSLFEYYIFGDHQTAIQHLPDSVHGYLGCLDAAEARKLRSDIMNRLNR